MLPSSWQRSITEKLFNNIRRCAIWKIVEEQLHLPAALVELGDDEGVESEIVGEEHQSLAGLRIDEVDRRQWLLEALARIVAGQDDGLIADQTGGAMDRTGIAPLCFKVGLGAGDEEGAAVFEPRQPLEIDVTAVHDIEGAGFQQQLVENIDVMHLAVADEDEGGDIAAQIEQRMELDGSLAGAERRPWEHREA